MKMNPSEKQTNAVSAESRKNKDNRATLDFFKKISSAYALSFLILAILVVGFVWRDLREAYRDTLVSWDQRLSSAAEARVRTVTLWRRERRMDIGVVIKNPLTARLLSASESLDKSTATRQGVEGELEAMRQGYGYLAGAVLDSKCRIAAQVGIQPEISQAVNDACGAILRDDDFRLDGFGMEQGHLWLTLSVPVFAGMGAVLQGQVPAGKIGAVVMVSDPWKDMTPLVVFESPSTRTSDTLFVWQKNGEAFTFSPRLHNLGTESIFRRPLSGDSFESRVAREGYVPFGEFIDYRGVRVFGAARPIAADGDALVRKVDRDEALSDYRRRVMLDWLVGALSLLMFGSVMVAVHRHAAARDSEERTRQQEAMEESLRESEERYRRLFEVESDAILLVEVETTRILDANAAALDLYGYSRGEILGLTAEEVFAEPEKTRAAIADEWTGVQLRWHRKKDGTAFPVEIAGNNFFNQGRKVHVAVIRDITGRQRAEEELRLTQFSVEHASDGVFWVDAQSRIVYANEARCRSLEYSREELLSLSIPDIDPFFPKEGWKEFWEQIKRRGSMTFEAHDKTKQGRVFPVEVFADYLEFGGKEYVMAFAHDITERKRAEQALRDSEQRYRDFIAHSTEGVWRLELEQPIPINLPAEDFVGSLLQYGYFAECNEPYARIMGFSTPEELVGIRIGELIPPSDEERMATFRASVQGGLRNRTVEFRGRDKAGNVKHLLRTEIPIVQNGMLIRVWGTTRDITESKRSEEALQHSEQRYRALFENAPLGIYRTTPDGQILAANPALLRMFGCSSFSEMAGINLNTYSFGRENPRTRFMELMDKEGEAAGLESAWYKINGDILYVRENARAIRDASGKILYYEGTMEDITGWKQAEAEKARLATAIEQAAEAVMITDTHGTIEYVNPAFTRISGYGREELLGQNPRMLKSGKQDPEFYHQLWATILQGKSWRGEIINQRKDGTLYTEEMNIAAVRGTLGEITHFIATKQDVTDRRTLEGQLRQAVKMEAVGRLAGGIAHDFNNLLTIINGYSELLMDSLASDAPAKAHLKEIYNAGERAAALIRQLLAFSRRQVLAPQVLDLNTVVSNLENMLRRLIGEDIKLHTVLDPALGQVKADPGQIEQVIVNLAVNARDAMPLGGSLTIETGNVELDETFARGHVTVHPGPHIMLAVSDTGVGMAPETQAHIFEPFFTTKEKGKGTGLGLATVYGIVKQSGGSIWVYSETGHGTVFKVYLPAVCEDPVERGLGNADASSTSGGETILVVEDEQAVCSLIRRALESAGYRVLVTEDGDSALATCANHGGPIHLLLTDVVMPKMSGSKVAEKVAAMRPGIKVLFMSGYTNDAIVHHDILGHDMPFIQKPFAPVALRERIREVLDRE
jgi:PAS domain S-box-containing protein